MSPFGRLFGRPRVRVVRSTRDVEPGEQFRFPKDSPHLIRMLQTPPEGITTRLKFLSASSTEEVALAGVTHGDRARSLAAFIDGKDRSLDVVRCPVEGHPNAIKVIGHWTDKSGRPQEQELGWLPSEYAEEIARDYPDTPLAATVWTMFRPRPGKSPGMRMHLWRPRKRRKRKGTT